MRAGDLVRFKYTGAKDEDWKVVPRDAEEDYYARYNEHDS